MDTIRKVFENHSDVYNEIRYYASYFKPDVDIFEEWKQQMNHYLKAYQINIEDLLSMSFVKTEKVTTLERIVAPYKNE